MEKVPWRNFNFGEDWELTHRAMRRGIKVKNLCIKPLSINVRCSLRGFGETRYVKNSISYYKRTVRDIFDLVLSNKFSPYFMLIQSKSVKALGKRWPLILLLSVINLYEKEPTISYVIRNWEYLLPEEMGLPREWFLTFFFGLRLLKCAVLEAIKDKIMSKTRDFKVKYDPQLDILFVYRDEEVFKFARDM
ncbi:MAG: hypothetical protein NZ934_01935, partial [Hadesarchaea archaeon]|nr:hypothetical protein [Hadesarchaea archaeon]